MLFCYYEWKNVNVWKTTKNLIWIYLDCFETHLLHFPKLHVIPFLVGQIILKNNNNEQISSGEAATEQSENVWSINLSGNKIIDIESNELQHMFPKLGFFDLSKNRIK